MLGIANRAWVVWAEENDTVEIETIIEDQTIENQESTALLVEETESLAEEEKRESSDFESDNFDIESAADATVSTLADLLAALGAAPTNATEPYVINIISDITLTGTGAGTGAAQANAVPAGNRAITGGRNIVLISSVEDGIDLMVNAVARHFTVGGNAILTIGEGVNLRRVSESTTASAGGGIQVLNTGRLVLDGGRITNNLNLHGNTAATAAVGRGAGVRILAGGTFDMFAGVISGNRTTADGGSFNNVNRAGGGGIAVDGTFNLHGGTISGNWSQGPGGGLLLVGASSVVNMYGGEISGNWNGTGTTPGAAIGGQGGGAIAMHVGTTFNMYGGMITNNFTGGVGGDGGAFEAATSTINLFGGTISGNNGRQGGAINNHEGSTLNLLNPSTATDPIGREIAMAGYATTGVIIENNIARISGGGVVQRGGGGATTGIFMHAGTIRNNEAIGQNTAWDGADFVPGSGGGVYLSSRSFTMNGGVIQGNIAQNTTVAAAPSSGTNQGGGGVYILAGTTFTMNDGRILDNQTGQRQAAQGQASSGGGGIHNRGTFHFNGGEISGNQSGHTAATSGGGGIFTPLSLTIPQNTASTTPILLENNTSATTGGAIAIISTNTTTATVPTFTMTQGTIRNNEAATAGNGLHYAPILNMNATLGTAVTTGTGATTQFTINGTAEIEDINYVPVVNFGRTGAGTLTIHREFNLGGNAMLSGLINIAPRQRSWNATAGTPVASSGTGAHNNTFNFNMTGDSTVLNGLAFTEHPAGANLDLIGSGGGGGVRTNHYTVTLTGGTINGGIDFRPHVSGVGGTAGSRVNNVTLNLNGTAISGRTTENGGVIRYEPILAATGGAGAATNRTNNSNLNLDAGIIQNGIATNNGGGLYHRPHSTLPATGTPGTNNFNARMRNVTVTHNHADNNGGGIYLAFATTGGGTQTHHFNMSEPGAFTRTITHNYAGNNGGGLYLPHQITLTNMINGQITHNTAETGYGGGIFVQTPPTLTTATGTLTLNNTQINHNISQLDGASIWVNRFANLTLNDTIISHNQTLEGSGGGLHFDPIGTADRTTRILTLSGTTRITENQALMGSGGGIYTRNTTLNINNNTQISENIATSQLPTHVQATMTSTSRTQRVNALFQNQEQPIPSFDEEPSIGIIPLATHQLNSGGGIYGDNTIIHLNDTVQINHNRASQGGGVQLTNGTRLYINDETQINHNIASIGGGLSAIDNSEVTFNDGTVSYNSATQEIASNGNDGGGGIRMGTTTHLEMNNGIIAGNISSDTAGGLMIWGTAELNGGLIGGETGNTSRGGGIRIAGDQAHVMMRNNMTITNNRSTGFGGGGIMIDNRGRLDMENGTISENQTTGPGGGIVLFSNGTAYINNGTISENRATTNGGAISIAPTTMLNINGGIIRENDAPGDGGALFMNADTTARFGPNAHFIDNEAGRHGGVVYVNQTAHLEITESTLTNNHASGNGGAIFTENYEYDVTSLSPDTYINLELENVYFANNTAETGYFDPPELTGQTITAIHVSIGPDLNPINNYDINFEFGPTETFDFTFIKMNQDFSQPLDGAEFQLERYQSGDWLHIATQTSDVTGEIHFEGLIPSGLYRLIETQVPVGYRLPDGYWRLEIDEEGQITITAQGDFLPAFRQENETFLLGNIREFDIPILGGFGLNQRLILIGLTFMLISSTLILIVRMRRKMQIT